MKWFAAAIEGLLLFQVSSAMKIIWTEDERAVCIGKIINPDPLITRKQASEDTGDETDEDPDTRKFKKGRTRVLENDAFRWPYGIVPYELEEELSGPSRSAFLAAIEYFQRYTCITFVPRNNSHADYVLVVQTADKCSSAVGRQGGEQILRLSDRCTKGRVLHELMHTLGWEHEHSRIDRDDYIRVNVEIIQLEHRKNYLKYNRTSKLGKALGPYSFGSIMHYTPVNGHVMLAGQSWMTPKLPLPEGVQIGQRLGLDECDISRIRQQYLCTGVHDSKAPIVEHTCNSSGAAAPVNNGDELVNGETLLECQATARHWKFVAVGCVADDETQGQVRIDENGLYNNGKMLHKCVRVSELEFRLLETSGSSCMDADGIGREPGEVWSEFWKQTSTGTTAGVELECDIPLDSHSKSLRPVLRHCIWNSMRIRPGHVVRIKAEPSDSGVKYVGCSGNDDQNRSRRLQKVQISLFRHKNDKPVAILTKNSNQATGKRRRA